MDIEKHAPPVARRKKRKKRRGNIRKKMYGNREIVVE